MRRTCNDCGRDKNLKARGLCSVCWNRRWRHGTLEDAPTDRSVPVLDGTVLEYLKLAAKGYSRRQAAAAMGIDVDALGRLLADTENDNGIRGAAANPSPLVLRLTPSPGHRDPRAACRVVPPALFYATSHEKRAKATCRRCPIKAACLEWALSTEEPHGVYGGMTAEERRAEIKRRRPSKTQARSAA